MFVFLLNEFLLIFSGTFHLLISRDLKVSLSRIGKIYVISALLWSWHPCSYKNSSTSNSFSLFDSRPSRLLPKILDHGNIKKQHILLFAYARIHKLEKNPALLTHEHVLSLVSFRKMSCNHILQKGFWNLTITWNVMWTIILNSLIDG